MSQNIILLDSRIWAQSVEFWDSFENFNFVQFTTSKYDRIESLHHVMSHGSFLILAKQGFPHTLDWNYPLNMFKSFITCILVSYVHGVSIGMIPSLFGYCSLSLRMPLGLARGCLAFEYTWRGILYSDWLLCEPLNMFKKLW